MTKMGIFEAKAKFSEICETVASLGEPVIVTRRGVPLVRIEPIEKTQHSGSSIWDLSKQLHSNDDAWEDLELPKRVTEPYRNPLKGK